MDVVFCFSAGLPGRQEIINEIMNYFLQRPPGQREIIKEIMDGWDWSHPSRTPPP